MTYRLIIFTCIYTPYTLAFVSDEDIVFTIIDQVQNLIFLVDIIINFLSAYYDREFNIQDDIKVLFLVLTLQEIIK